jgi:3-oxoadipate enol-lactonase
VRGVLPGSGIAYAIDGEGPPLLLLHAFPLGLVMWDPQAAALKGSHQLMRFDSRGFGDSPPGSGPLTMDQISDDAASLLDHLGIQKAIVGGCSMGGYATFAFARRHGSRLRGLILADTRGGADSEEGREKRSTLAQRVLQEGPGPVVEAFLPGLLGKTSHKERPALVASLERIIRNTPALGIANALLGLGARHDSNPHLKEISVPTLVLCGEEDTLTPRAESEHLARAIPHSRLQMIPKAGHLANLENPGAFNGAVVEFLRSLAGGVSAQA